MDMVSSNTNLSKSAMSKGWRYAASCVAAILVFVTFHVYRMAAPPALATDLAGAWQACVHLSMGSDACRWYPVRSPVIRPAGQEASESGHYRRTFLTPTLCDNDACSLLVENVQNIASLSLNGHFLTGATGGVRTPIVQALPPSTLSPSGESNTLAIYTIEKASHVAGWPARLGLVSTKDGQRYLAAYGFHNVFAPLAGSIYLLVIAALCAVCPVPGARKMPIFRATLNYCVLSSAFLFNLSATVQEVMPPSLNIPVHCLLRFLCDWTFAVLVLSIYDVKSKWVSILHGVFGSVVSIYMVFTCAAAVRDRFGWDPALLDRALHTSILGTSALTLCGALIGLFHANATRRPVRERVFSFAGFLSLFLLQVRDLLVNVEYEQGSYASRTYPLLIGLVAAGLLIRRATLLQADERLSETNAAMRSVAAQVVHDIRSPLAALNMVTRNLAHIPEDNRVLVREAVNRINEIANSLTFKNIETDSQESTGSRESIDTIELGPLVDVIVAECQVRLPRDASKSITLASDPANYGRFVKAQSAEVKRLLCNLINNGVEASHVGGEVRVAVRSDASFVRILIKDDGPGIPPEIRARLGARGATFGKKGGSGLGLYHAKTCLESWGGSLAINERVGQRGVEVEARFPLAATPRWHLEDLRVRPSSVIVIVDDDESIHEVWRHRFRSSGLIASGVQVVHLDTIAKLQAYLSAADVNAAIYLVDLEINGVADAGITAMRAMEIESQSVLVTSRADEPDVKSYCTERGIKLLHKRMAEFIPIKALPIDVQPDVVLIDDDELIHRVWRMAAKRSNRSLLAFKSRDEFFGRAEATPRSTPIYVDYNLSGGTKGDAVCRELLSLGYTCVHIATGDDSSRIPEVAGVIGVTGKDPPASWS